MISRVVSVVNKTDGSRTILDNDQRLDCNRIQAFDLIQTCIEVDFKPVMGIDERLKLVISDIDSGEFISIGLFDSKQGSEREVRTYKNFDTTAISNPNIWEYGEWYRFVIDSQGEKIRLSLCDSENCEIWGNSFEQLDTNRFVVNLTRTADHLDHLKSLPHPELCLN